MNRAVLYVFASRLTASAAQAGMLLLLARQVTPSQFGAISALIGIGAFLAVTADLGGGALLLKVRAIDPDSQTVRGCLRLVRLGSAVTATGVLAVYLLAFGTHLEPIVASSIALWCGLDKYAEGWVSMLIADRRPGTASTVMVVRRVLPLAIQPVLISRAVEPAMAFAVALAVGALVGGIWARIHYRGQHFASSFRQLAQTVRSSGPFWLSTVASQTRELEPAIVQSAAGAASAGYFSLAFRLNRPVQLLAVALAQVLLPEVARRPIETYDRSLRRIASITVAMSVAGLVSIPFAPTLIASVLGDPYTPAAPVVQIFLATIGPAAMTVPLGSVLQAINRQSLVAGIGLGTSGAALIGVLVGSVAAGAVGASLAVGACYSSKFVVLFWVAKRVRPRDSI